MKKRWGLVTLLPIAAVLVSCSVVSVEPKSSQDIPNVNDSRTLSSLAWVKSEVYVAGIIVNHKAHSWKAKWWTLGEEPGTTGRWGVWTDLGVNGLDTVAPSIPGELLATESTLNAVSFTWRNCTDNTAVVGYRVYENGVLANAQVTTMTSVSGAVISGLQYSTSYTYTVTAFDAAGNESAQSAAITVSTLQGVDVIAPKGLTAIVKGASEIMVVWDDVNGATAYELEVDGGAAVVATRPFAHQNLQVGSAHTYRVRAINSNGVSPWSDLVTCTTSTK
jgi:chitodextrinase